MFEKVLFDAINGPSVMKRDELIRYIVNETQVKRNLYIDGLDDYAGRLIDMTLSDPSFSSMPFRLLAKLADDLDEAVKPLDPKLVKSMQNIMPQADVVGRMLRKSNNCIILRTEKGIGFVIGHCIIALGEQKMTALRKHRYS